MKTHLEKQAPQLLPLIPPNSHLQSDYYLIHFYIISGAEIIKSQHKSHFLSYTTT